MKKSPRLEKLEEMMRSSKIVSGGFLGQDMRSLPDIIDADAAAVAKTGYTLKEISDRMMALTEIARPLLGNWIKIGQTLEVCAEDYRCYIICPWPHPAKFLKGVVSARNTVTGKTVRWTFLSIHLIGEHGFFEGKGSEFRIEPQELVDVIFLETI